MVMSKPVFSIIFSKLKNQKDEQLHIELAQKVVEIPDEPAVKYLIEILASGNDSAKGDALKVLYEIAKLNPKLAAPAAEAFLELLDSKSKRLIWGAMIGLSHIVSEKRELIFDNISTLGFVASQGSVIAKDHT